MLSSLVGQVTKADGTFDIAKANKLALDFEGVFQRTNERSSLQAVVQHLENIVTTTAVEHAVLSACEIEFECHIEVVPVEKDDNPEQPFHVLNNKLNNNNNNNSSSSSTPSFYQRSQANQSSRSSRRYNKKGHEFNNPSYFRTNARASLAKLNLPVGEFMQQCTSTLRISPAEGTM